MFSVFRTSTSILFTACFAATASIANTASEPAPNTAFQMAIAEHTPRASQIAEFYRTNGFSPIWVGETAEHTQRRARFDQGNVTRTTAWVASGQPDNFILAGEDGSGALVS